MSGAFTSEDELIQTYFAPLTRQVPGALGLMDDCAHLIVPPGRDLIVGVDAGATRSDAPEFGHRGHLGEYETRAAHAQPAEMYEMEIAGNAAVFRRIHVHR